MRAQTNHPGPALVPRAPVKLKLKNDELRATPVETPPQNAKRVGIENAKSLSAATGKAEPPALKTRQPAAEAALTKRNSMSESKSEPTPPSKPESSQPLPHQFGVPERFANLHVDEPLGPKPDAQSAMQESPKPTAATISPQLKSLMGALNMASMDAETFKKLMKTFNSLSPEEQAVARPSLEKGRSNAQLSLMKTSIKPIVSGMDKDDPFAVSLGVHEAKDTQLDFLTSIGADFPSETDLKNLMAKALPPSSTPDMHLAFQGLTKDKEKMTIKKSKSNKVLGAVNPSFHGFRKETQTAVREQASNLSFLRDAVAISMKKR